MAFGAVLSGAPVSDRSLDSLVSQHTFLGLPRRPSLSIWPSAYYSTEKHFLEVVPPSESVKRVIRWARDTLCLLACSLRPPVLSAFGVSDASHWGAGEAINECPESAVREAGRYSERWRFRTASRSAGLQPRQRAFDTSVAWEKGVDTAFEGSLRRSDLEDGVAPPETPLFIDPSFPGVRGETPDVVGTP